MDRTLLGPSEQPHWPRCRCNVTYLLFIYFVFHSQFTLYHCLHRSLGTNLLSDGTEFIISPNWFRRLRHWHVAPACRTPNIPETHSAVALWLFLILTLSMCSGCVLSFLRPGKTVSCVVVKKEHLNRASSKALCYPNSVVGGNCWALKAKSTFLVQEKELTLAEVYTQCWKQWEILTSANSQYLSAWSLPGKSPWHDSHQLQCSLLSGSSWAL